MNKPRNFAAWIPLEFAIVALWFASDIRHWHYHLVVVSKTINIVLLAWISLRLRGMRWRDVGLRRPEKWGRAVSLGVLAGLAMEALELFATQPLLERIFHKPPDLTDVMVLYANWRMLLLALLLTWTLAAFGEEMAYRGYLLNRLADLFGRSRAGWAAAIVLCAVAFGLAHYYQGVTGMTENFVDGLLLTAIYFASGRNLWAAVIAHGVTDSVDSLLLFSGHYPGLHT